PARGVRDRGRRVRARRGAARQPHRVPHSGVHELDAFGELMFMVILGGTASIAGPVLGAFALLLVEDALSGWTQHWQLILGPLLVLSVLFLRRGLSGLLFGKNE